MPEKRIEISRFAMNFLSSCFFSFLILVAVSQFAACASQSGGLNRNRIRYGYAGRESRRRILHQPLFPGNSAPPLITESPSPPAVPEQPFFPTAPSIPSNSQPPPSPSNINGGIPPIAAAPPAKPRKKVAIFVSVGIVALGMLSALGFFLCRHRARHASDTQKFVNEDPQRFQEDSLESPSSFLCLGTVGPSQRSAGESKARVSAAANASPYRKLNSVKSSNRYRPSPELQPLPPLAKQAPTSAYSPSALSSFPTPSWSDEESRGTSFYTPNGSAVSNDDAYQTPFSRSVKRDGRSVGSVSHSKRSSSRSKLSAATTAAAAASLSPEMKHITTSEIKPNTALQQPPPSPPYYTQHIPNSPALPDSPPKAAIIQATIQKNILPQRARTRAPPPPPPPPPPPLRPQKGPMDLLTPRKPIELKTINSAGSSGSPRRQQVRTPSPTPKPLVEVNDESAGLTDKNGGGETDGARAKLKPLHWDKVRASSDRATVWDQLKSSSFQLNEDMIEHLFGTDSANSAQKEPVRKSVQPLVQNENRVLDPKKSQNIAILLKALNVTRDEVSEALLDGNPDSLGSELLETLVKMAPSKEEEIKLRDYSGDISKLGTAERFLKTILDVPFAFKRVEAMLYRANFDTEVRYLKNSFQTLEQASEELKNSRLFMKLLEAVLKTGNRMNTGTNRGDAKAFKLDTLLKLADVKGTDGKTSLLHFVVQEIIRSEDTTTGSSHQNLQNGTQPYKIREQGFKKLGLQVVADLSKDLSNVRKAAGMDSDVLSGYVSKLETGLEIVKSATNCGEPESSTRKFFVSMNGFLKEAELEISKIKDDERRALLLVREVTWYFHGDAVREEAHPLRIFLIVRDFLGILDSVCKEVRTMQERPVMGSASSFRISGSVS